MSWQDILKQTALVGRDARSPNIWLHRKATTRNLGRPMTSKPTKLSTIPVQVPTEKFDEYYSFFASFYSRGGWEMYSQGSLQQGLTNDSVKRVLKDFERGNIKTDRKYSKELDDTTEKALENTIEMMKKTAELLMVGSRSRIREGRDLMRYAKQLEESYDKGILKQASYYDILKVSFLSKNFKISKQSLLEVVEAIPMNQKFSLNDIDVRNEFAEKLVSNGVRRNNVNIKSFESVYRRWALSTGRKILSNSPLVTEYFKPSGAKTSEYIRVDNMNPNKKKELKHGNK